MLRRHCFVVSRAFQKDFAITRVVHKFRYGADFFRALAKLGRVVDEVRGLPHYDKTPDFSRCSADVRYVEFNMSLRSI